MFRLSLAIAPLALVTLPVTAQAAIGANPAAAAAGAMAGRSPHQAYRPATAASSCASMHNIPAGKLPVFGKHALPKGDCAARVDVAERGPATVAFH
jgi:hypothetical protein